MLEFKPISVYKCVYAEKWPTSGAQLWNTKCCTGIKGCISVMMKILRIFFLFFMWRAMRSGI
jgi:hypothetical protein